MCGEENGSVTSTLLQHMWMAEIYTHQGKNEEIIMKGHMIKDSPPPPPPPGSHNHTSPGLQERASPH